MVEGTNSWNEWGKHVLLELEENKRDHREIEKVLRSIKVEIAMLKVKSGIWGFVAGFIPVALAMIIKLLMEK